jgi:hypothetical protein
MGTNDYIKAATAVGFKVYIHDVRWEADRVLKSQAAKQVKPIATIAKRVSGDYPSGTQVYIDSLQTYGIL